VWTDVTPEVWDGQAFDDETDLLVVGFGAAGASAAIEARSAGLRVRVADRFQGGGATRLSAGIVYFGGGTRLQKDSGWDDSPDQMFRYLALETRDAVSEATLHAFCDRSVENFEWLCRFGVPFPSSGKALKTSYPPDDCTLYFSGNELCPPYCDEASPAPRGHRALGKGLTGHLIFAGLQKGAIEAGAEIDRSTRVERLITDERGDVIGAVLDQIAPALRPVQTAGQFVVNYGGGFSRRVTRVMQKQLDRLETRRVQRRVRARRGVVLSAGGFVFNPDLMKQYAPDYADCSMRLGTAGDDGHGIMMGRAAGGAIANMDRCCAWRFINPPSAWTRGVLIGPDGSRICNEELYGSKIGEYLAQRHRGRGVLILDTETMELARKQLRSEVMGGFQLVFGALNNYVNYEKADDLASLADKCGIPPERMIATIDAYNEAAARAKDPLGKSQDSLRPLTRGPFYAVNCDIDTIKFPTPCITLGGLVVDGTTQRVVREDGTPIDGLYAAGRNAVGVSSKSYVSGLSVADGIFSGRNAGAHAARVI
jgi:3-oxo-5alpha-steroid 4-dehydrogenase